MHHHTFVQSDRKRRQACLKRRRMPYRPHIWFISIMQSFIQCLSNYWTGTYVANISNRIMFSRQVVAARCIMMYI